MNPALDENTKFVDSAGAVVVGGLLYFGVKGADPKLNPITIYSDNYRTKVLANPQTTNSLGQAPTKIFVSERYSFRLSTSADVLIFEDLDSRSAPPKNVLFTLTLVAGTNVITASSGLSLTEYVDKQQFTFKAAAANTGAVTLNVDNLGAKSVVKNNAVAISSGNIEASQEIIVVYNKATDNFEWVNQNVIFVGNFISTGNTITSAGQLVLAHGLDIIPRLILFVLVNVTADNGYVSGDILGPFSAVTDPTSNNGISCIADSTNLTIRFGSGALTFTALNATTGVKSALTNSSWTFEARAYA